LPMQSSNASSTTFLFKDRNWTKIINEKKKTKDGCSSSFLSPIIKPPNSTPAQRYQTLSYLRTSSSSLPQTNSTETLSQPPHNSPQWTNPRIHQYPDIPQAITRYSSKLTKTTHLHIISTMVHGTRDPQTSHTLIPVLNVNPLTNLQIRSQILQSTSALE
jgi:hypothetical protein